MYKLTVYVRARGSYITSKHGSSVHWNTPTSEGRGMKQY